MSTEVEDMDDDAVQKRDIINLERIKALKNKELRILVESFYDMQKLRIAMGNRVRQYGKAGLLSDIDTNQALEKIKEGENGLEKQIAGVVKQHPLWDEWFSGVKGIGPVMAAGVIAWRDDISKADTISAFWKYHGLAPSQSKRKRGEKLDYNPKAKTHAWKIGMQLLKAKGKYSDIYYISKAKYEARSDIKEMHETGDARGGMKSYKLHIHYMALRKMIKQFLADTWVMWRTVEGLPVTKPYIFSVIAKEKGIAHEHYELPKTDKQIEVEKEERTKELLEKYK